MASVKGGDKLLARLKEMGAALSKASSVDVGFLPGKTYPDGTLVALVAAMNEFGHTIMPAGSTKLGVEARAKLRTEQQEKGAVVPPRPFFRGMIAKESGHWGRDIATLLKQNDYDTHATLTQMGKLVQEELQQSINDFVGAPLKASTIARKGFDKQLVDTAVMLNSVEFKVKE